MKFINAVKKNLHPDFWTGFGSGEFQLQSSFLCSATCWRKAVHPEVQRNPNVSIWLANQKPVWSANQKLVSFMCGLGLDGAATPVPSGLAGLSGVAAASAGDAAAPRRGDDAGVKERLGLGIEEAGLVGEGGVALRCEEEGRGEADMEDGVPGV